MWMYNDRYRAVTGYRSSWLGQARSGRIHIFASGQPKKENKSLKFQEIGFLAWAPHSGGHCEAHLMWVCGAQVLHWNALRDGRGTVRAVYLTGSLFLEIANRAFQPNRQTKSLFQMFGVLIGPVRWQDIYLISHSTQRYTSLKTTN